MAAPMASRSVDLDALFDFLAERIAARLQAGNHGGGGVTPRLLTVEQAAIYLGRTESAIRHMTASGELPVVRADRRVFLDRTDLDQWIANAKREA
jgi:excisionase family DNA binding protein